MLQTPHRQTPPPEASISSIQATSHLLIEIWLDNLVETETCWSFFLLFSFFFKPDPVLFAGLGAVALLALLILVACFRKCRNHSKAQPHVFISNRDHLIGNKATVSEKMPAAVLMCEPVPVKWSRFVFLLRFQRTLHERGFYRLSESHSNISY